MKFRHTLLLALLSAPLILQPAFADRGDRGGGGRGNHGGSRSFDGGGQRAQTQRSFGERRSEGTSRRTERGSSGGVPSEGSRRSEWRERSGGNDGWRQRADGSDSGRRSQGRVETPAMPGGMATGSFPSQQRDGNRQERRWQGRVDGPKVPGVASNPPATINPQRDGNWRDSNNSHREHRGDGRRDGDRNRLDGNRGDWNNDRRGSDRDRNNRYDGNRNHNFHNNGRHHGPSRWHSRWSAHHGWHDIRHFRRHHYHGWKGGHWHHGYHGSRFGWWWVVGPSFYFYSGPVYPYPDPYIPPAVVIESVPIMQSEEADPDYYYFCENPEGYYPYIQECSTEWVPVPAEPEDAPYG